GRGHRYFAADADTLDDAREDERAEIPARRANEAHDADDPHAITGGAQPAVAFGEPGKEDRAKELAEEGARQQIADLGVAEMPCTRQNRHDEAEHQRIITVEEGRRAND